MEALDDHVLPALGTRVVVFGLKKRAAFNGCFGHIARHHEDGLHVELCMEEGGSKLRVRPEHISSVELGDRRLKSSPIESPSKGMSKRHGSGVRLRDALTMKRDSSGGRGSGETPTSPATCLSGSSSTTAAGTPVSGLGGAFFARGPNGVLPLACASIERGDGEPSRAADFVDGVCSGFAALLRLARELAEDAAVAEELCAHCPALVRSRPGQLPGACGAKSDEKQLLAELEGLKWMASVFVQSGAFITSASANAAIAVRQRRLESSQGMAKLDADRDHEESPSSLSPQLQNYQSRCEHAHAQPQAATCGSLRLARPPSAARKAPRSLQSASSPSLSSLSGIPVLFPSPPREGSLGDFQDSLQQDASDFRKFSAGSGMEGAAHAKLASDDRAVESGDRVPRCDGLNLRGQLLEQDRDRAVLPVKSGHRAAVL